MSPLPQGTDILDGSVQYSDSDYDYEPIMMKDTDDEIYGDSSQYKFSSDIRIGFLNVHGSDACSRCDLQEEDNLHVLKCQSDEVWNMEAFNYSRDVLSKWLGTKSYRRRRKPRKRSQRRKRKPR